MSLEFVEAKVTREHHAANPDQVAADQEAAAAAHHLPPPQYPASEASSSSRPPPFSSLFATVDEPGDSSRSSQFASVVKAPQAVPAYIDEQTEDVVFDPDQGSDRAYLDHVAETKRALPSDTKGESSRKDDDTEPPPAYSEGSVPLDSFTYVMAAAGGAASIITQVQQGGPPINSIGG